MQAEPVAREDAEIAGATYLYGNLSSGDSPAEGQVSPPLVSESGRPAARRGTSASRESALEPLEEMLAQHLDDPSLRERVRAEVVAVYDAMVGTDRSDQAVVERHLWSITQITPALVRDIVEATEEWPVDRAVLRRAMLNVTSSGRAEQAMLSTSQTTHRTIEAPKTRNWGSD